MTTSPTIVSWPLNGSISTKNAPLILQPGSQLVLDNVRQERANEWRTRAGTTVNALDAVPGGTAPLMSQVTPEGGFVALIKQPLSKTAGLVYTDAAIPRWHAPPVVTPIGATNEQSCCQQTPGLWSRQSVSPAKGVISAVSSATGDGYRLTAWWSRFANSGVQVSFGAIDGTNISSFPSFGGTATAVRPRCVFSSLAHVLVLVYVDGSGNVLAARWDTTTGLQLSGHTLSTNANTFDPCIDVIWYGGDTVTVAFRDQIGGALSIVEYNPAANTSNEYHPGIDASKCVSLWPDPDASGFRFVAVTTAIPEVHVLKLDATGTIVTDDNALALDATNIAGCAYQSGSGWMMVAKEFERHLYAIKKVGGAVGAAVTIDQGAGGYFELASNGWREPNTDAMKFLLITFESGQMTYSEMAIEYDTSDVVATAVDFRWNEPQARMLPLNASLDLERGAVPQVFRTAADVFVTALGRITGFIQSSTPGDPTETYAVDAWTVQYMNESNRYTLNNGTGTTTQADSFLPAGTLVQTATGQLMCGHGASAIPFKPMLVGNILTGGLLLKLYQYGVTVEMPDENGLTWRSPMSLIASLTLVGSQNAIDVNWFLTPFENLTRRRIVKLWRTDGDGSEFKLLHVIDGGISDTVNSTYTDLTDDVGTGEPFSGEIQASITPAFSHVALWNNRMWGVQRDYPSRISFSKPLAIGFLPEFPGEYEIDVDDAHGDATGLAPMDDKIVLFKGNAIYVAGGDGPANDGSGAFPAFQLINSESGAIAGSPFVSTGAEVYFVSKGGLFWVTRAQEVAFVGAAIDAYLSMPLVTSPETVIGMIVSPNDNEVRVQTTNYRFVHDRIFDIWVRDTGAMDGSYGIVQTRFLGDLQVFFTNTGAMWFEAADSNTPTDVGITFQGVLRSPWMRPSNMEGWLRLYQMRAVAECLASGPTAQPVMSVYYDNDDSLVEHFGPRVVLGNPGPVRANAKPRRQLCTAFSPQLTLPAGNASIRFDSWAALVAREPSTQPVGGERNWIPVTLPPPSPPGSPLFWYKGDAGVTMDGFSRVSGWADQTANHFDMSPQNSFGFPLPTGAWPVFTPNVVNGIPGMLYDGAATALQCLFAPGAGMPTPDDAPVTVLALVKANSYLGGAVCTLRLSANDLQLGMIYDTPSGLPGPAAEPIRCRGSKFIIPPIDYTNVVTVMDWEWYGSTKTVQCACTVNGVPQVIDSRSFTCGAYDGENGFSIGYVSSSYSKVWNGYIVEVIGYLGTDAATITAARNYLNKRAGR